MPRFFIEGISPKPGDRITLSEEDSRQSPFLNPAQRDFIRREAEYFILPEAGFHPAAGGISFLPSRRAD